MLEQVKERKKGINYKERASKEIPERIKERQKKSFRWDASVD